jgi:uncharacterized protein YaeQ
MALGSTQFTFDLSLSDVDRGLYETFTLKVACHPSESAPYMLTRVLAYAFEYQEGLAFSQGLSTAEQPALWVHDLTGQLKAWIEVGVPDAARLHKASKACDRVVVYCHKDMSVYLRSLVGQKVYAAERVRLLEVDRNLIEAAAQKIERRTAIALSVTEGQIYLDIGGESFTMELVRHPFPA